LQNTNVNTYQYICFVNQFAGKPPPTAAFRGDLSRSGANATPAAYGRAGKSAADSVKLGNESQQFGTTLPFGKS
jgi:hypothetical protein